VKFKVIVVGAGISGLTAAYHLKNFGYDVEVLEALDAPGGRMRQVDLCGVRVNTGARMLFTYYKSVMELIHALNIEEEIEYIGMSDFVCQDRGQSYAISFAPDAGLLFNPALKLSTRLRLVNLLPDLLKARFATNPDDMTTSAYADNESMEEYFTRKVGADFVSKVANPLFRGARSWNANDVSPAFFLSTTAHMFGHKAFTFRQGIGYLNEVLASKLDVKYEVSVTRIERNLDNQGVTVHCLENGATTTRIADIIVCATEGAKIKDLVTSKSCEEEDFAGKIRYNSLGIVYHVLKNSPEHRLTFFTQNHSSPLAILESVPEKNNKPNLFCELAPETVKNVGEAGCQDTMDELIIEDSCAHYPALDKDLDYSVNQWIEHMLPVFYPGYIAHLDKFSVYQNSTPNSIYYCGDYMAQALVGGACDSGKRVAEQIRRHHGLAD